MSKCMARPLMSAGLGSPCAHICSRRRITKKTSHGWKHPGQHVCRCGYSWGGQRLLIDSWERDQLVNELNRLLLKTSRALRQFDKHRTDHSWTALYGTLTAACVLMEQPILRKEDIA